MSKLFNKYVAVVVVVLLLLATAAKISSALAAPPGHDRNAASLRRIDSTASNYSFDVWGDSQNSTTVFGDLVKKVNADDALFAVDNGDLVFDGEMEKYRAFVDQVRKLDKPLLTSIGNHELYANGRGNYYDIFGPFYYSFTVGPAYFIVLDNADGEGPDPWQARWLSAELEKSQAYKYRFVFMHIPLYDTRTKGFGLDHGMDDQAAARRLNALLDRYHVTMLFASHIHEYDRGVWGKTPYIITGGAGGELAGTDPAHDFFHYMNVTVTEAGVKYRVVRLKGPRFSVLNRLIFGTWFLAYTYLAAHYLDIVLWVALLYLLVFALYTVDRRGRLKRRRTTQAGDA